MSIGMTNCETFKAPEGHLRNASRSEEIKFAGWARRLFERFFATEEFSPDEAVCRYRKAGKMPQGRKSAEKHLLLSAPIPRHS
jgi:hypothetical protein